MKAASRKVVVTQKFFDAAAVAHLEASGCEVEIAALSPGRTEATLDENELCALLDGASGWIVGHANVSRALLARLPALAVVSRRGVGYEKVDTRAVRELGKVATIAAGGNDASVADQAIGMMIALGRRFREAQQAMNGGDWRILVGTELYRKRVGIVGFGRTGKSLAQRLGGFEADILVHSPRVSREDVARHGLREVGFDELVESADYISLHAPLNEATRHLIAAGELSRMKPEAVLINTARGGLVSDAALLEALQAGEIAGAGLDVFESESDPGMKPVTEQLIALPNVIAAPHAGASTREALERTNFIAAQCVVDVLEGRDPPPHCVVADGRQPACHGGNRENV